MTIEFARNVLKNKKLTSQEFDEEAEKPVGEKFHLIHYLPGQNKNKEKGGTLRLGSYECKIRKNTKTYKCYKKIKIEERHRHRYEFNNEFRDDLEKNGLIFSGINPQQDLVEIAEIENHPFMIGCQFHPEFKSRPNKPHPLFLGLIKAGIEFAKQKEKEREEL